MQELTDCMRHTDYLLAKVFGYIQPWVRRTLEAYTVRVVAKITTTVQWLTREFHERIDSFEAEMVDQLHEAEVPHLLGLREEIDILRSEVRTLDESNILIIS